jgi:hypothetical protein
MSEVITLRSGQQIVIPEEPNPIIEDAMTNPTPEHKRMVLAGLARRNAFKLFVEAHQEEWKLLLGNEREKLGLSREPSSGKTGSRGPTKKEQIEALKEQLRAMGVDPVI